MKVFVFLNALGLGGTEKAACKWARGLMEKNHQVVVFTLADGPRRRDLERLGIEVRLVSGSAEAMAHDIKLAKPDVIHAHCPGYPHEGDILGRALAKVGKKIPVAQTNIFGKLSNPSENTWTDFRLFISWTSCVQAARRSGSALNSHFFQNKSVAVYPVDLVSEEKRILLQKKATLLRQRWGVEDGQILFGRFSRPEPNKWTDLPLLAFLQARKINPNIKLLLREPPPSVAASIRELNLGGRREILVLPATSDEEDLQASQMACDAVLHGSSIGESFGYGIAELMALEKPVIANSVPWNDQAQVELIRHGEGGILASTVPATCKAILRFSEDRQLLADFGKRAGQQIRDIADPIASINKVEEALWCAVQGNANPHAEADSHKALKVASYLDRHQWGHSIPESLYLRLKNLSIVILRKLRIIRNSAAHWWLFFDSAPMI